MGVIDETLQANRRYAQTFQHGDLPAPPARGLAVVACMDARLSVERALGLATGDAHVIRNAGGIVTDDVIRSLVISHHLLSTREVMVINHTGCGMQTFEDEALRDRLRGQMEASPTEPAAFHAFSDLTENVRLQMERIRSHPWIPDEVSIRGFIYDVQSGKLKEVGPRR